MGSHLEKYLPIIFNNDGSRDTNQYFDEVQLGEKQKKRLSELHQKPALLLDVLHFAFTNQNLLFENYTPYQLANSLEYLFNPSFAEFDFIFQNRDLELIKQIETIRALGPLFIGIFEPHAESVLGFMSMSVKNKKNEILNHPCYMFWDSAYIPWNCDKAIVTACVDVMGLCARSSNIAVVEGALHGLGHMVGMFGDELDNLVQEYVDRANTSSSKHLKSYAAQARLGRVL